MAARPAAASGSGSGMEKPIEMCVERLSLPPPERSWPAFNMSQGVAGSPTPGVSSSPGIYYNRPNTNSTFITWLTLPERAWSSLQSFHQRLRAATTFSNFRRNSLPEGPTRSQFLSWVTEQELDSFSNQIINLRTRRLGDIHGTRQDKVAQLLNLVEVLHSSSSDRSHIELNAIESKVSQLAYSTAMTKMATRKVSHARKDSQAEKSPKTNVSRTSSNSCIEVDDDPDILRLFAFRGQEELVRASRLAVVMRLWSAVFSLAPTKEAYELSDPVETIDCFVSHNWSESRSTKHACFLLQYNLRVAVVVTFLVAFVIMVIAAQRADVTVHPWQLHSVVSTVLLGVLFFYRDLTHCARCKGPTIFLDKTCVNQVDPELQRRTIDKIGAFVVRSSSLVVIYSDQYLQKLWTVYEVACFLALRSVDSVTLIVSDGRVLTLRTLVLLYFSGFLSAIDPRLIMVSYFVALIAEAYAGRSAAHTRASLFLRLSRFNVRDCSVTHGPDRPLLYSNIGVLMRAVQLVPDGTSDEGILDAFSRLIQEELPGALATNIGWVTLSYANAVALSLLLGDHILIYNDFQKEEPLVIIVAWLCLTLGVVPFGLRFLALWTAICLQVTSLKEKFYVASGILIAFGFHIGGWVAIESLLRQERYITFAVFALVLVVVTTWTFLAVPGEIRLNPGANRRRGGRLGRTPMPPRELTQELGTMIRDSTGPPPVSASSWMSRR